MHRGRNKGYLVDNYKIKSLMDENNYTRKQLAEACGYKDPDSIGKVLRDPTWRVAKERLQLIAQALGVRPEDLIRNESKTKSGGEVTLGQLLDLLDRSRESEEIVELMQDGKVQARAMVCSEVWNSVEDRYVNAIQSEECVLRVWLY